jgi:hypothetical protein
MMIWEMEHFYVNNLDSYMFVIVQICAFDVMFTGREVGHIPSMCVHAEVHACTHTTNNTY